MRATPESIFESIRAALERKPESTTVEVSAAIGCGMRESYAPLMRLLALGEVTRRLVPIDGKRSCWVYSLKMEWVNIPTPAPYPSVILTGEWQSDMLQHMNLNRR